MKQCCVKELEKAKSLCEKDLTFYMFQKNFYSGKTEVLTDIIRNLETQINKLKEEQT